MADNLESGPFGNVVGANGACAVETSPPSPTKLDNEIGELYNRIKQAVAGRTRLPDSVSAVVAFWAISTWFLEAFSVFPYLVITGPAHEAMVVLGVLNELCWGPTLLAGFRRADLKELTGYRTEPNLDNRTAALLGNLTNRHFIIIEERSYLYCAGSRAIYIGEDITIERTRHSLYIDSPHGWNPRECTLPRFVLRYLSSGSEESLSFQAATYWESEDRHGEALSQPSCSFWRVRASC